MTRPMPRTTTAPDQRTPALSAREKRVLAVLSAGGKYSVADIVLKTHFSDPRSAIADLRKKGVAIKDEWRKCAQNGRYKVYFV